MEKRNLFGGYDYIKILLTDNLKMVRIKRKFLFFWEYFSNNKKSNGAKLWK